jgi:hypothetical protein
MKGIIYIREKIDHVSKRPHQASCVILGRSHQVPHVVVRHHIKGAMSVVMDIVFSRW